MTADDDSPAETAAIGHTANGGGYVSVTDDEGWKALFDAGCRFRRVFNPSTGALRSTASRTATTFLPAPLRAPRASP